MPGPIPKRSDQRRRVNKPEIEIATATVSETVVPVPAADPDWHPIALRYYESLATSGQSAFYEPSDWAHAQFVMHIMSELLKASRLSAQLMASVDTSLVRLMVTEGDRRRLRVELERRRAVDEDEDAAGAAVLQLHKRVSGH